MAHVAFEGAHRVAPWRRMTFMLHVTYSDALLIGAKWLRLKFSRFCSQAPWGVPWFVALQGISSGENGFKSHRFLCVFMRHSSETSMKFGRNSTTEESPIRRLLSSGNTPPLHNFGHFWRCVPPATLSPRLAVSDASGFSFPWRRLRCAAPVTHQGQGLVTSRCVARRLPLASWMPQKTLGSLPCPIVYSAQRVWLPRGSNFDRAHGRGVAQLSHSAAGSLS
jgi:hypothetical protein